MNSEVKYFRINSTNTAIATSNSGDGAPSEELVAPIAGGTYSSGSGTTTITNQTAGAFSVFSVGQYLYYINNSTGEYILMGQIASIASPVATTLTLTANSINAVAPTAGSTLAASYSLITISEPIYMRVKTDKTSLPNQVIIPNFRSWRTSGNNDNGVNNEDITVLEQISNVGVPVSNASTITRIPFTIRTMNTFTYGTGTNASRAWPTVSDFPSYMWIRVTPANANAALASKTLYRWTTQETFDGITASAGSSGLTATQLQSYGYNTTGSVSNDTTVQVGGA
jgi:hypothetical protein